MAPIDPITLRIPQVKTYHKHPYPSISPLRPELSQKGKTVLILGASSGIGFAIARGFVQANAKRVILLGRREGVVREAAEELTSEALKGDKEVGLKGEEVKPEVVPMVCDISDLNETKKLWEGLKREGVVVDVLVLNAAVTGKVGSVLQNGFEGVWRAYEVNVRSVLDWTARFYGQGEGRQKYLINVSTSAVHNLATDAGMIPTYGATKNAAALLVQQIAKDTNPDGDMQAVSFHPGAFMTDMVRNNGVPDDLYDWDDAALPGQFAVWLASPEARFAHGRMLAAHWDVDELMAGAVRERMERDVGYLRIGVLGMNE